MSEHHFDPEVVALLDQIAADPSSSLLKLPRRPLKHWIANPAEVVSPHADYLTKAEKHLALAYREEAAWVLLEGCVSALKEDPLLFTTIKPDVKRLRIKAMRMSTTNGVPSEELLRLAEDRGDAVSLGLASLRLAPSDLTRNAAAYALERDGDSASSLSLLQRVINNESSATQKAQAYDNSALVWAGKGEYRRSLACNEQAARLDETQIRFLVWCLTSSLQLGAAPEARNYMRLLETHPRAGELDTIAAALEASRKAAQWKPTARSQPLALRVRSGAPAPLQRICDAFQ